MPIPKDPEKRKLWKERQSKAQKGKKRSPFTQKHRDNISKAQTKKKIHKICPICKKDFEVKPSLKDQECCRNKCRFKMKSKRMLGKKQKPLTQEHKDNISRSRKEKGIHHSQKTRDKMSKNRLGKKNPMFGKKRPDLAEFCRQQVGEKNPNFGKRGKETSGWQGGISFEPYTVEFNKELKKLIRQRDSYKCQKCGCSEIENIRKLSIHHIDYQKENCLPENLTTLCLRCNGEVNKNREKWIKYFQNKVKNGIKDKQLCLIRL